MEVTNEVRSNLRKYSELTAAGWVVVLLWREQEQRDKQRFVCLVLTSTFLVVAVFSPLPAGPEISVINCSLGESDERVGRVEAMRWIREIRFFCLEQHSPAAEDAHFELSERVEKAAVAVWNGSRPGGRFLWFQLLRPRVDFGGGGQFMVFKCRCHGINRCFLGRWCGSGHFFPASS